MKPAVGIGGALTLLEAGDFIAARQRLLEVARTQVAWIGEDFQGSYPLHPYMTGAERTEVLDWFRTARAEYYVDMETGAVQFDDQPKPVESRPGDDGLGRRGCGAVVTEEEALKLVSRSLQAAEVYGERAAQAGLHDNWGRADRAREKAEKLGDELRQLIRGLTRTATSWKDSGSERETMALGLPRGVIDRAVPLVSRSDPDPVPAEGGGTNAASSAPHGR